MLGSRGRDKLSRAVYLAPTWLRKRLILNAHATYFKLSECEDVSIINIIQIKLSCFLTDGFIHLAAGVWTSCPRRFNLPPNHLVIHLAAGMWSRLGWAVQGGSICPHPPGINGKIIFSFHIFQIIWMWSCINYNHNPMQIKLLSLSYGYIRLVAGVGASSPGQFFLLPTWITKVKFRVLIPINYNYN